MQPKIFTLENRGMNRDIAVSMSTGKYAYENMNIRLTPIDNDTLLAVTNEKGTLLQSISDQRNEGGVLTIKGTPLGYCVLNEYLIVFTHDTSDSQDYIYRLELYTEGGQQKWRGILLYSGELGFSLENPIETLAYYESEDLQKVYWVDGINQPRVINIKNENLQDVSNTYFNFITELKFPVECSIQKSNSGNGSFSPGVIQYFITYNRKYGQETNIAYQSPLYYISDEDKGNAADDICTCSFTLTLTNLDSAFDYVRIYSVQRSSINGTPSANLVASINIGAYEKDEATGLITGPITVIDTGVSQGSIDAASLLYIGGREIIAGTITQKDNTMFLGDIELNYQIVDSELSELFANHRNEVGGRTNGLSFVYSNSDSLAAGVDRNDYNLPYYTYFGYYPYESQLNYPSDRIKTFKGGNKYRIGIQFKTSTGASTQVYWIGDITNSLYPEFIADRNEFARAIVQYKMPAEILAYVRGKYSAASLYMAEPSSSDRLVKAQGVLSPTVFMINDRTSAGTFTMASWCFRPYGGNKASSMFSCLVPTASGLVINSESDNTVESISTVGDVIPNLGAEMQHMIENVNPTINIEEDTGPTRTRARYYVKAWRKDRNRIIGTFTVEGYYELSDGSTSTLSFTSPKDYEEESAAIANIQEQAAAAGIEEFPDSSTLSRLRNNCPKGDDIFLTNTGAFVSDPPGISSYLISSVTGSSANQRRRYLAKYGNYFFVEGSTVTMNTPELYDGGLTSVSNMKFRVIGYINITANQSDFTIDMSPASDGTTVTSSLNFSNANIAEDAYGLSAFPLVQGETLDRTSNTGLWTYLWHKTGSMSGVERTGYEGAGTGDYFSELNSKTISNMYYSYSMKYLQPEHWWQPESYYTRLINSAESALYVYRQNEIDRTYQSDYSGVLSFSTESGYVTLNTGTITLSADYEDLSSIAGIQSPSAGDKKWAPVRDPIEVAYKCTDHVLISFNNTIDQDGNSYWCPLPEIDAVSSIQVDNTDSIPGVLLWEESVTDKFTPLDCASMVDSTPLLTVDEVTTSGGTHKVTITDQWEFWERLHLSLIEDSSKVVYVVFSNNSVVHAGRISFIERIKSALNTPEISNASIDSTQKTVSVSWTSVQYADKYEVEILSENSQVYTGESNTNSLSLTGQDWIIADTEYTIRVRAVDNSRWFNNSDYGTFTVASTTDGTVTENQDAGISTMSAPSDGESQILITATDLALSKGYILNDIRYSKKYLLNDGAVGNVPTDSARMITTKLPSEIVNSAGVPQNVPYPYLLIGEIYVDDDNTAYGGNDENSVENNTFIPIGKTYNIDELRTDSYMLGTEGDAFFQRWDCLKTEPYSESSENSVVEMLSFMVESYRNLDGRYDSRRGLQDNTSTTSENTNLINEVYSQSNNFITGATLDEGLDLTSFPSQITWTRPKTPTEEIDTWTNITLASTLDMDGDKGRVTALRRLNNTVVAFQEKGIAEVLFNSRTQMATTSGVPVELMNSGTVDGKRYISDKDGCINKWSIVETAKGVYFIDNINSSISIFNGQAVQSLSNMKGFKNWMSEHNTIELWTPSEFNNYIGFYDRSNDDVYFVGKDNTLCFNEFLQEFTSFYSYHEVPVMATVKNKFMTVGLDGRLWEMHEGEYNNLMGEDCPYYVDFKVTPDAFGDKIFTNLEYRADMFEGDEYITDTFNELHVGTEYQDRIVQLIEEKKDKYPDVRRKFRIWRMDIPRDKKGADNPYGLNRIRNPWLYLRLGKTNNLDQHNRMVFHNLQVKYFE